MRRFRVVPFEAGIMLEVGSRSAPVMEQIQLCLQLEHCDMCLDKLAPVRFLFFFGRDKLLNSSSLVKGVYDRFRLCL